MEGTLTLAEESGSAHEDRVPGSGLYFYGPHSGAVGAGIEAALAGDDEYADNILIAKAVAVRGNAERAGLVFDQLAGVEVLWVLEGIFFQLGELTSEPGLKGIPQKDKLTILGEVIEAGHLLADGVLSFTDNLRQGCVRIALRFREQRQAEVFVQDLDGGRAASRELGQEVR